MNEDTNYSEETVTFNQSILVTSNSTLSISNCTIQFDSSEAEDLNVSVANGSRLEIRNSTLERLNEDDRYYFYIMGELEVDSAIFHDLGGKEYVPDLPDYYQNYTKGFDVIDSPTAEFSNASFPNSPWITISCKNSYLRVSNVSYEGGLYGIIARYSDVEVRDTTVFHVEDDISFSRGLYFSGCNVTLERILFDNVTSPNTYYTESAVLAFCNGSIRNCTFLNSTQGLVINWDSQMVIEDCQFIGVSNRAIDIRRSNVTINNSTFVDNECSIYFERIYPTMSNLTFLPSGPGKMGAIHRGINSIQFSIRGTIQAPVYRKGNITQFESFGEGYEITQLDGNVFGSREMSRNKEWNQVSINSYYFNSLNDDIFSTPLMVMVYYKHNESYANTTLGELMYGGPLNISIALYPEKLPDLTVTDLFIYQTQITEGDLVMIRAIIRNVGDWIAHSIDVKISATGSRIHTVTIPSLSPGEYYQVNYLWKCDRGYGKFMGCSVDPDREIREHDDRNNSQSVDVEFDYYYESDGSLETDDEELVLLSIIGLVVVGVFLWKPWGNEKK